MNHYSKTPVSIRFSDQIIEESGKYLEMHSDLTFSSFVRMAVMHYLRVKMTNLHVE